MLLALIRAIVDARPACDHKRVYRVMKLSKLLLPKFGPKPQRDHRGRL